MKEPTAEKSENKDGHNKELIAKANKKEELLKEPNPSSKEPIPVIPYPQKLRKSKLEHQYAKFREVFKKLHINIPFAEALEQMPSSMKYLKEIPTKKRKLGDYETKALSEECSAILQKKTTTKAQGS